MAKLRRLGNALLAASEGLGGMIDKRDKLALMDRQEAQLRERQLLDDQRAEKLSKLMKGLELVQKQELMPSQGTQIGNMLGMDLSSAVTPEPRRADKIRSAIEAAKIGETVDIPSLAKAQEIPEDTGLPGGVGDEGPAAPTTYNSLTERQTARQKELLAEETRGGEVKAKQVGAEARERELAGLAPDITEGKGKQEAAVTTAREQAKADVDLAPDNVRRRVRAAAQQAYATTLASKNASTHPLVLENEFKQAEKLERMKATVRKETDDPTEAEARAGAYVPIMAKAHKLVATLEAGAPGKKPIGIRTFDGLMSDYAGLSRLQDADHAMLMSSAKTFSMVGTLIISGVTARPDELARLMSAMFPFENEPEESKAHKRTIRDQFVQSAIDRAASGQRIPLEQLLKEVEGIPQPGKGGYTPNAKPGATPAAPGAKPSYRDSLRGRQ